MLTRFPFKLLQAFTRAGALQRAESWRSSFAAHSFRLGGLLLNNTLSAGVALWPDDAGKPEELLLAADRALYRAKNGGRNRMESATSEPISC